ncbi:T-cell leukemia homeobox protein 3-like isoform X1 [Ostrinia furnacalis]|uniref:T-cell leukemia homeobox protein 3-like isoform X1 n=1 Tax=Ostrinia furnacalis TaxID=93504 RepID=UPI00103DF459|nr:T-cell leukemia homeobox protein 3-like isoform X1 [Ostrinia furnacalis]
MADSPPPTPPPPPSPPPPPPPTPPPAPAPGAGGGAGAGGDDGITPYLPIIGGIAIGAGFLALLYFMGTGEPEVKKPVKKVEPVKERERRNFCDCDRIHPSRRKWPIDEY